VTRGRVAVVAALVGALAAGLALFPRSLEPGRAESSGILLKTAQGGSGDWFSAGYGAELTASDRRLVVKTGTKFGRQAVTRPLAVFPHTRYRVRLSVTLNDANGYLRVMDARLRRELVRAPLPPRAGAVELVFDTGTERRVALLLIGSKTARIEVSDASLERLGRPASS
jgi:hypothetical protein